MQGGTAQDRSSGMTAKALLVAGALVLVAWFVFEPYQSHYLSALAMLGDTATQAYWGVAKGGRGDEWSTYLPMLKQAYLEGFPAVSALEPYRERLDWFIAIPHADLSLLFLPNHLLYWFLPGGKALSFQGLYYNAVLLGSAYWLMRNLGVGRLVAVTASLSLAFSHFYQVWWTSNFPALAMCLLPFAILTSRLRDAIRWPALSWAVAAMLLGQMYPPFYFGVAVGIIPFVLAVRTDLLRPRTLALAAASAAAGLGVYLLLEWDYVAAVAGTSYPGSRVSTGGESNVRALLGVLFPTFPSGASGGYIEVVYNFAIAGTIFPALALAVLPFARWDRDMLRLSLVSAAVALLLGTYAVLGFPPWLAKATGFSIMPARRAHLGLSLLVLFYSAWVVSRNFDRLRPAALLAVGIVMAAVAWWSGVPGELEQGFPGVRWYGYLPLAVLSVAFLLVLAFRVPAGGARAMASGLLVAMAVAHVAIFGSFNPVMRASDILRPVDTQFTRDLRALQRLAGDRPLAIPGNFGHVLRGEGLPALQAIHMANVEVRRYQRVFPELSIAEATALFDQFRGIGLENAGAWRIEDLMVYFPLRHRVVAFRHTTTADGKPGGMSVLAGAPTYEIEPSAAGALVYWNATLAQPLPVDAELTVRIPCQSADGWVSRYPLAADAVPGGVALQGVVGGFRVESGDAAACASGIGLFSTEGIEIVDASAITELDRADVAAMAWSGSACAVDEAAGKEVIEHRRGDALTLSGFVVGPGNEPARDIGLLLKGERNFSIPVSRRIARADVGDYFGDPRLSDSGFAVSTSLQAVPPGSYEIHLTMRKDGATLFCEAGKTLRLGDAAGAE